MFKNLDKRDLKDAISNKVTQSKRHQKNNGERYTVNKLIKSDCARLVGKPSIRKQLQSLESILNKEY